jgi:hypothetical protein
MRKLGRHAQMLWLLTVAAGLLAWEAAKWFL